MYHCLLYPAPTRKQSQTAHILMLGLQEEPVLLDSKHQEQSRDTPVRQQAPAGILYTRLPASKKAAHKADQCDLLASVAPTTPPFA